MNDLLGASLYPGSKPGSRVTADAVAWAARRRRPFFMFLNYYDAHEPYVLSAPYDTLYSGHQRAFHAFGDEEVWTGPPVNHARLLGELRASYDAAIAYEDAQLAALFAALNARGLLRNAIVVVTADHGELFGEYGLIKHGDNLYPLLLHVPLIWYAPGRIPADTIIRTPVSLRDLARTLVTLAGDSSESFPGASLLGRSSVTRGGTADVSPIFSSVRKFPGQMNGPLRRGDMRSLIAGSWHYILNGDEVEELYDLRRDTLAATNLARQDLLADTLRLMRRRLSSLPR
jgi:arylsulfatase A-like enzyme